MHINVNVIASVSVTEPFLCRYLKFALLPLPCHKPNSIFPGKFNSFRGRDSFHAEQKVYVAKYVVDLSSHYLFINAIDFG